MLKGTFFCAAFLLLLICCQTNSFAGKPPAIGKEEMTQLSQLEDTLVALADSMKFSVIPDERIDFCVRFTKHLRTAMEIPGSFGYPFKKLDSTIHIVYPEDRSFRIFNWLIAPSPYLRRYFGAIQMNSEESKYFPLRDDSDQLGKDAENQTVDNNHWYGCEIYRIMQEDIQGQKSYILFGLNTNGINSNKKLLDVLSFDQQGPVLGAKIFMMPDIKGRMGMQSRVILEYKKSAQIFLNYDAEKKMIVFNRLASEITDPNKKYTYIPTGQMDGLRLENGSFVFVRDAIPVLKLQDGQAPIDGVMK